MYPQKKQQNSFLLSYRSDGRIIQTLLEGRISLFFFFYYRLYRRINQCFPLASKSKGSKSVEIKRWLILSDYGDFIAQNETALLVLGTLP